MSMYGTYKIYKDGKLVAEQKNKLTTLGRGNALKAMLGQNQYFANVFGIGVSSKTNENETFLTRTDLEFTVGLYPISMGTLGLADDNTTDGLVYIARITDTSRYNINEIGLFSMTTTDAVMVDDLTIFNFESGDPLKEVVSGTTYYVNNASSTYLAGKAATIMDDQVNYRIGSNAIKMTGNTKTIFFDDVKQDMSDIEYSDKLVLAAYSSNAGTRNVTVKFYSAPSTFATYTYALVNGYNILSLQKNAGTNYDTVDWKAITKIEVTTPSNLSTDHIIFDGLRVKQTKPVDATDGLVSRAVLTTPIEKDAGSIIDIQYILSMGLDT